MWLLIQMRDDAKRKKFITSESYDNLLKYIARFPEVKKYDEYHFTSIGDEIINFTIELTDYIDRRK